MLSKNPAAEIVPGLWLGGKSAACDIDFLNRVGVKVIINCTKDLPVCEKLADNVRVYRIPIDDPGLPDRWESNQEKLYTALPYITKKIHNYMRRHYPILVHCYSGAQRSAAVVLATLLRYGKDKKKDIYTYRKIAKFIVSRRPVAFARGESINFWRVIKKFISIAG